MVPEAPAMRTVQQRRLLILRRFSTQAETWTRGAREQAIGG
jgi:hypothetical protein